MKIRWSDSFPLSCVVMMAVYCMIFPVHADPSSKDMPAAVIPGQSGARIVPAPCFLDPGSDAQCTVHLLKQMKLSEKIAFVQDGKGVARLGLPDLDEDDGPNGLRGFAAATAFPAAVAVSASFDTALAHEYGVALGVEDRLAGHDVLLGPTINIMRTWRWGRSAETFGEDPLLTGRIARAEIDGIQSQHVIAMVKHFVANDQEAYRFGDAPNDRNIDEIIDEAALQGLYYPAFRAAVENGGAAAVMCSYPRINGQNACENKDLLARIRAFGLEGYIEPDAVFALHDGVRGAQAGIDRLSMPLDHVGLSRLLARRRLNETQVDHMALHMLGAMHRIAVGQSPVIATDWPERHEALARAIAAEGTVLLRNRRNFLPLARPRNIVVIGDSAGPHVSWQERGSPYVADGNTHPGAMDAGPLAAIRRRAARSGIPVMYAQGDEANHDLDPIPSSVLRTPDNAKEGLRARYFGPASAGGRLLASRIENGVELTEAGAPAPVRALKNDYTAIWDGVLRPPVSGTYRFALSGEGTARLLVDGHEVTHVFSADFSTIESGEVTLTQGKPVSLRVEFDARDAFLPATFTRMFGNPDPLLHLHWHLPEPELLAQAIEAARKADVAIVVAGDWETEGADRLSMRLPVGQDALIDAISAANPRTVVVLNTGGPVEMPWRDRVRAIVEGWYPGQAGSDALAAMLFGDVSPGGRLPLTFPVSGHDGPGNQGEMDYPGKDGRVVFTEGANVGYRWFAEHGVRPLYPFGYGLTYGHFTLRHAHAAVDPTSRMLSVHFSIHNSGHRDADAVPQLYLIRGDDRRALIDYARVRVPVGRKRAVDLRVPFSHLAAWDTGARQWTLPAGKYTIAIGWSAGHDEVTIPVRIGETSAYGDMPPS